MRSFPPEVFWTIYWRNGDFVKIQHLKENCDPGLRRYVGSKQQIIHTTTIQNTHEKVFREGDSGFIYRVVANRRMENEG